MTKLKIDGMTCGHCVMAVTKALAQVPGVDKVVEVSLAQKQAVVSGSADGAALVAAVVDAGYEAQVV
jgi:copper chaperone